MTALIVIDNQPIRKDDMGRYCLNDLHKAAVDEGKATTSQRPSEFLKSATVKAFVETLSDARNVASVEAIRGGMKQGTYADELVAMRYAAWIDPEFEIKVYTHFRDTVSAKNSQVSKGLDNKHQAEAMQITSEVIGTLLNYMPNLGDTAKQCLIASMMNPIIGYDAIALPRVEEKFYTTTELAEAVGSSAQMVGRTANQHSMKQELYGEHRLSKSQYSSKQVEQWYWNQDGFDAMCNLFGSK